MLSTDKMMNRVKGPVWHKKRKENPFIAIGLKLLIAVKPVKLNWYG